ncbi:MAG: cytochrome c [Bacteroidetes bacterium]|nr:cytochrome c [Bacteroidota bacterium]
MKVYRLTIFLLTVVFVTAGIAQDSTSLTSGVAVFSSKCAGCHQFGKVVVGPDLNLSKNHPDDVLHSALGRMEAMTGPLTPEEKSALIALIRSENPSGLLTPPASAEPMTVKSEDALAGEALYVGSTPLTNGGMSCISCHTNFKEQGTGNGKLGPSLRGAYTKFGEAGLVSAIQNASFRVMREPYKQHPITADEAAKLTAFLKSVDQQSDTGTAEFNFLLAGSAIGGILIAIFFFMYGARIKPVRQSLKHY